VVFLASHTLCTKCLQSKTTETVTLETLMVCATGTLLLRRANAELETQEHVGRGSEDE
jgi:hypothetical protein